MNTRLGRIVTLSTVTLLVLAGCQRQGEPVGAGPTSPDGDRPVSDSPGATPATTRTDGAAADRGTVRGQVRTADGSPVVDAVVQVRSLDDPPRLVPELAVTTDQDGHYRWLLRPGRYELSVAPSPGAAPVTSPAVEVDAGQTLTVDLSVP